MEDKKIKISDLRKVKGIGNKTIQRIKEQFDESSYVSEYSEGVHLNKNKIYQGDCLHLMNGIPDKSIDMILCDLPYGTTPCSWDSIIDSRKLWKQYNRIIKDNGAIVLTSSQPFTTSLIGSNIDNFKYTWVWDKVTKTNHLNARKQPMRRTEDIVVFYKNQCTYNPQGLIKGEFHNYRPNQSEYKVGERSHGAQREYGESEYSGYPDNLLTFSNNNHGSLHPTQKPVQLFKYLIKTYTNEGDIVLDNCIGSGTTAIASIETGRDYIGIELNEEYVKVANERVEKLK